VEKRDLMNWIKTRVQEIEDAKEENTDVKLV